jgi:two-component system sensor histidine kinase HydH
MERILANALGQDVTQMAATEKQLLLGRLLARLAHEVRNPLSSLDIHVQLLEEDLTQQAPQMKKRMEGRFEIIHGELRRLENIVKHFLRLAGPSALDLENVDLAGILGHVCELLRPEAGSRRIDIALQVSESLPNLTADPCQLTQAFVNLVINAIQAVDRDGRIAVNASRAEEDGFLRIEFQDTGPGVPPDKFATIFEPFVTTKPDGSGLGLWIAQQIVHAHGGAVEVANPPGGGAIFTVRLPTEPRNPTNG